MNREEAVLHITADYVAELQAGHSPRLSDYLARHPQYADEIAEFVTYYHAIEVDLPGETLVMPSLSEHSSAAVERAWERVQLSEGAFSGPFTDLLAIANRQHISLIELVVKSGLSQDIIEKLARRMIAASTLPQELLRRFAALLEQPLGVIAACFGLSDQSEAVERTNVRTSYVNTRVAEEIPSYQIEEQPDQSFREAMEQSAQLSDEQKTIWRVILDREGL